MTKLEKCLEFHKENPNIYTMFKRQVIRAINNGRMKISAYAVIEWVRWEYYIVTKTHDEYKISNDMKPFYARLFVFDFPHYVSLFNFSKTKVDYGYLDDNLKKLTTPERQEVDKKQLNMF